MMKAKIDSIRIFITRYSSILLWIISAWIAYRLILNGIRKFDPEGMWTNAFENWGYPVWFRIFIGVLETVGGLMVLIPKVRYVGSFICFTVMLGALVTRIINGTSLDDALSITFYAIAFLYFSADHENKLQEDQ